MLCRLISFVALLLCATFPVMADSRTTVIDILNGTSPPEESDDGTSPTEESDDAKSRHSFMKVSDDAKSWRSFFDGCLDISSPPNPLSDSFNMNTVWPRMVGWSEVTEWASQNEHMEDIFVETTRRAIIGLPYGRENVPANYASQNVFADIGTDGHLNNFDFGYIQMVKLACLWATAESYVLFEEGETDRAMQLMMSEMIVLRKFCDREFLKEKMTFMDMLSDALANSRDMFYMYRADIMPTQFRRFSKEWLPNIRVAPTSLLMPVGDQILGEALLESLFDEQYKADSSKFNQVLTQMQVEVEPLTGFGATRYWTTMADLHRGKGDSLKRMDMIYDDWWRRWKLRFFHPMLSTPTHFENANAVNYAAVKMIVRDTEELFKKRKTLLTQINGTIVSAALCGYHNQFGEYPTSIKKMYAQLLHRINNLDPMRKNEMRNDSDWDLYTGPAGQFHYRVLNTDTKISTLRGSIPIERGECLLYGLSFNEENDGGLDADLDTIIWPPMKSLERNAGLLN